MGVTCPAGTLSAKPTKHHEPSLVKRCIMPSSISVRAGSSQ
jgi:hypothetical protein